MAERPARGALLVRAAVTCILLIGSTLAVGVQIPSSSPHLLRATTQQLADASLNPGTVAPPTAQPLPVRHDRGHCNDLAEDASRAGSDHRSHAAASPEHNSCQASAVLDASHARAPPVEGSV